jgi:DNA-binding beta-propeller fold protein YncE
VAEITHRRVTMTAAVLLAIVVLPACGGGSTPASSRGPAAAGPGGITPERIVPVPKGALSAAEPQPDGTMWVLAGTKEGRSLSELDPTTGQVLGSIWVSGGAQSVAQTLTGVIGLALGIGSGGALELLDALSAKVIRTVSLGAAARDVAVGSDGTTFFVLTGRPAAASVTLVDSADGRVRGMVPVPPDAVSAVPDTRQDTLYVLLRDGRVSEISIASGKVTAVFVVGDAGRSLALSPDGATLYVLKDTAAAANVAAVDVATESVRRVLPAPGDCREVLVSASGNQLYDVVGTAGYGNIQVFAI